MKIKLASVKGVITVFVALMLASVLSLGTLVIEAGRFQAAKTQLTDANVSASTSMIAAYDATLYERYGLLAIDTENFTPERCREYLDYNADLSSSLFGNKLTRMYSISSVELQGMYNLTYPAILKRQILSRAKYHVIPQDYALNLYNVDSFFSDLQNKCNYVSNALKPTADGSAAGSISDVSGDMQSALTALYNTYKNEKKHDDSCAIQLTNTTVALLPSTTGTVESNIPSEDVDSIQDTLSHATSVLGGDASKLASTGTAFSQTDTSINVSFISDMTAKIKDATSCENIDETAKLYASNCRSLAQGINAAINLLSSDAEGNLLLNSYIANYFSNRNFSVEGYVGPGKNSSFSGDNANFAAACVEYIFGGSNSEITNQDKAYDYLLAIRLINNLYSTLQSSSSFNSNSRYSTLAHIAWGYYESVTDVQLLTTYNAKVPFGKYNMILNPNNCASVKNAFSGGSLVSAMSSLGIYNGSDFIVNGSDEFSYRDSLALALWFVPNSEKMMHIADLIQLEMRYEQQYVEHNTARFLMSEQNTFCRVKCTAKLNSILPIVSLGSNSGIHGITFKSIKYAGY